MLELLVALRDVGPYQKGDIVLAKPAGAAWGRCELRPLAGQRLFAVIQHDDPQLEARLRGKPLAEPYRAGERRSTKRVQVDALSAQHKARLADPRAAAKLGVVELHEQAAPEKGR